jgi:Domain of unknown function (DUF4331)
VKKNLINRSLKMARIFLILTLCFGLTGIPSVLASSHAEAPMISMDRYADNTDVYAFRSSETGRSGFVTLISNFIPIQDPSGGPQFYRFDDSVTYDIKIDNTGDGFEDITYRFNFTTQVVNANTVLGHTTVNQDAIVSSLTDPDYNMPQTYTVRRLTSGGATSTIIASGLRTPPSNVGPRVTPNYETALAQPAIYNLPNGGKVFAGQRDEGFFLDLGVFDAIGYRSLAPTGGVDTLRTFNVNTLAVEVPIQELTRNGSVPSSTTDPNAVIGVWSTASRRTAQVLQTTPIFPADPRIGDPRLLTPGIRSTSPNALSQISRLGSPLVNEVVIPLRLKDAFNGLSPVNDAIAAPFILDPELPKIIEIALETYGPLGGPPLPNFNIPPPPRTDLVAIFATGIPAGAVPGLPNYTTFLSDGRPHEYLRLNVAIAPVGFGAPGFSRLGLLGGDIGGFPNGRRVGDDVVDIEVRALLGGTPFTPAFNVPPNNAFNDGVSTNFEGYLARFPYLQTPNAGNTPRPANFPAMQLPPGGRAEDDEAGIYVNGFPELK